MSLVSHRTAATVESNDTSSPVQNLAEDNESVMSQVDKAAESISDAGACGTSVSWSLLSLPTMQKTNHLVQFTPSQDVSTDDDVLHDILLGGVGMPSMSDQTNHPADDSKIEGQRLVMRPLLIGHDMLHQHERVDRVDTPDVNLSLIKDIVKEQVNSDEAKQVDRTDDQPNLMLQQHSEKFHIPEVPVIKSSLHLMMPMKTLSIEESHAAMNYDMNIPKEIFCYQEHFDEDVTETMVDLDKLSESMHVMKSFSSPCLLPCPKDQSNPRRQRRYSDSRDSGPNARSSEMSFVDIICRHQHLFEPQSDEEHSIPMIIIEVDRSKRNVLPPKDARHRRRSRASRDYQRRWQRRREAGLHPRVNNAPEYASV
jgi:hypothetical protein